MHPQYTAKAPESPAKKNRWDRKEAAKLRAAFKQQSKQGTSQRAFTKANGVPRTTFQSWLYHGKKIDACEKLKEFLESPEGVEFLHRLVCAALFVMSLLGGCGIRLVCQFFKLSGLDKFVACSYGTMQGLIAQMEYLCGNFGDEEKSRMAPGMKHQKLSVAQDETFHPEICLVAIELKSNYILLEKYVKQRDAATWKKAMDEALEGLNVNIIQSTSDEGTGLVSYVKKELGVHHSPDLFHIQNELNKTFQGPLGSRVRRARENYQKLVPAEEQPKEYSEQEKALQAQALETLRQEEKYQQEATELIQESSTVYHPFTLDSGAVRERKKLGHELEALFCKLRELGKKIGLKERGWKRFEKAYRMVAPMLATLSFFYNQVCQLLLGLRLEPEVLWLVWNNWLPGLYLESVASKTGEAKERARLTELARTLLEPIRSRDGPLKQLSAEAYERLAEVVQECVWLFQRSSSCVEGRNGQLELRHRCFHHLVPRKLKALTVVHNYFIKRRDGSTAAERFFGQKPRDLFEYLVEHMPWPKRPAKSRKHSQQ